MKCCRYRLVTIDALQGILVERLQGMEADSNDLPACPVETTLMLIGNKWQALILRDLLANGTLRFKELQRCIGGISQKVLTSNLRQMEAAGLVDRTVHAEVPPRVEYSLTPLGRSLEPVLDAMRQWGEDYQSALGVSGGRWQGF